MPRNLCLICEWGDKFSPKNKTCYCNRLEERKKCSTECDFHKPNIEAYKTYGVIPTRLSFEEENPLTGDTDNSSIEFLKKFDFKKKGETK